MKDAEIVTLNAQQLAIIALKGECYEQSATLLVGKNSARRSIVSEWNNAMRQTGTIYP